MRNLLKKRALFIFFALAIIVAGCKKAESPDSAPSQEQLKKNLKASLQPGDGGETSPGSVNVATLKTFFASLINANVNDITYNSETEQFALWGEDQVNKTQLTRMYNNTHNLNAE